MIEKCIECNGSGKINNNICQECNGKGSIKIESQLENFIGTYRVKACLNMDTNDFPRTEYGNIDPSFGDFYIQCGSKCEIRDALNGNLAVFVNSIGKGRNIKKELVSLYGNDIIFDYEETSEEVLFYFKIKDMDKIAKVLKPQISGASIKPFSPKNLPKGTYSIPEVDLKKYDIVISKAPRRTIEVHGKLTEMADGLLINRLTKSFDEVIKKNKGKKYNIETERKLSTLKHKEFIHSIGLWDEFISYLDKEFSK